MQPDFTAAFFIFPIAFCGVPCDNAIKLIPFTKELIMNIQINQLGYTPRTKKVEITQVQQAITKVFINIRGKFMEETSVNSLM